MTQEEIGELLAATAEVGNWAEVAMNSGRFILLMDEEASVSLSVVADSEAFHATADVASLLEAGAEAKRGIMEALLNANVLSQDNGGVFFSISPYDDTVTLNSRLPAKRGGERDLAASLSHLVSLVEAWRPLIRSIESGALASSARIEAPPEHFVTFRL